MRGLFCVLASCALLLGATSAADAQVAALTEPLNDEPVQLEDVVVVGRPTAELSRDFIDEVAAPPNRRGLARWRGRVCIGTVNVGQALAQPLIDHISRVALNYGVEPGEPD